jgi:hypothetical protein
MPEELSLPADKKLLLGRLADIRTNEYDNWDPDHGCGAPDIARMQEDIHTLAHIVQVLLHPNGVI